MVYHAAAQLTSVAIIRGPNIKPFPRFAALPQSLTGEVLLKVGDNVSTDAIMPAGNRVLPLRSNIPAISEFVFEGVDPAFAKRAREKGGGIIVGGDNYGQGSSREHAALAPRYLGVTMKIVKSFARIHKANLVNFGILPLVFDDPTDYNAISPGDTVTLSDARTAIGDGNDTLTLSVSGSAVRVHIDISERQRRVLLAGGILSLAAL